MRIIRLFLISFLLSMPALAEVMIFCEPHTDDCKTRGIQTLVTNYPQYFEFKDPLFTIKAGQDQKSLKLNQPLTYESEDEKSITLDKYFPTLNWLVVREVYDGGESIGYQIIDIQHQLKSTEIAASPVLSPDNQFFINFGVDLEAGFTLNGLVIYRLGTKGDIQEVFRKDDDWGVSSAKWISSTEIHFTSENYCTAESMEVCETPMKAEFKNNSWQVSSR